jgi:hypothetical protein
MQIVIDIPTDQYNEIVYVNYERLRDIVRDGVVIEKCEDAVSREAALLALTGMDLPTDRDKLIALFTNRIQHLPPVTPQRPNGKWIEVLTKDSCYYECSECGQRLNWVDENDHYCCRCGSRNDEGL